MFFFSSSFIRCGYIVFICTYIHQCLCFHICVSLQFYRTNAKYSQQWHIYCFWPGCYAIGGICQSHKEPTSVYKHAKRFFSFFSSRHSFAVWLPFCSFYFKWNECLIVDVYYLESHRIQQNEREIKMVKKKENSNALMRSMWPVVKCKCVWFGVYALW